MKFPTKIKTKKLNVVAVGINILNKQWNFQRSNAVMKSDILKHYM